MLETLENPTVLKGDNLFGGVNQQERSRFIGGKSSETIRQTL